MSNNNSANRDDFSKVIRDFNEMVQSSGFFDELFPKKEEAPKKEETPKEEEAPKGKPADRVEFDKAIRDLGQKFLSEDICEKVFHKEEDVLNMTGEEKESYRRNRAAKMICVIPFAAVILATAAAVEYFDNR